ncbi:hypothetical protein [Loktanella sp. Alg231-35]|uniref:hypothetical protein n=1 Tax=Loktanella sp. Alg231-35 TaxID=1922220 RepID=UPI001F1E5ED0|nr:hypothetical protein [Loktanella sp. Alg231-35]
MTATALTLTGTLLQAQQVGDTAVGAGLNTFGPSLHGEYRAAPNLGVRGMIMGGINESETFDIEDYEVDGKAEIGGVAVFADYYPLVNAWRVSGGLLLSNTEISGDFVGPESFEGEIALKNDIAPVITTGFNTEFAPGWSFSGDIGVVISSLEASSDSTDTAVQDEIDSLNDDLSDLPVLPYAGIAVSYRF